MPSRYRLLGSRVGSIPIQLRGLVSPPTQLRQDLSIYLAYHRGNPLVCVSAGFGDGHIPRKAA